MKKAVFAGTFDPISDYEYRLLYAFADAFEELVLVVEDDPNALLLPGERVQFLRQLTAGMSNVEVESASNGVLYCREKEIPVLIRGLHSADECQKRLDSFRKERSSYPRLDTLLAAADSGSYYSSSAALQSSIPSLSSETVLPESFRQKVDECRQEHRFFNRLLAEIL